MSITCYKYEAWCPDSSSLDVLDCDFITGLLPAANRLAIGVDRMDSKESQKV